MNIVTAIQQIHPGAVPLVDFEVRDDGAGPYIASWRISGEPPTAEQLSDAWQAAQPAIALEECRRARAAAYPAIGDQLDALWKGGAALEEMRAQVMAVKAAFPKP